MKSIISAILFFGMLWWGLYDLEPFKEQRPVRRRKVKAVRRQIR
jgi:hypothetical protein